jgi:acetyl esterase/lipase
MRWLKRILTTIVLLGLIIWLVFSFSVWPGALLVRATFKKGGEQMRQGLVPYERADVRTILDEPYRPGDPDAVLDVYIPAAAEASGALLPVVIWTHGGGWIAGDKSEMRGYLMQMANAGHVVIALNYSLAPEHAFPTPLHQINAALAYITQHAARFRADMSRVFMAGDSAGAQLTAQTAVLTTNAGHAAELGITPVLQPGQLRGLILHCGLYDMVTYVQRSVQAGGFIGYGTRILPWAYTGQRQPDAGLLRTLSPMLQATPQFPPVFISGGNGDPLTAHQSRPMAARLRELGVEVTELFFADDHQPALPHEYQFNLNEPAARQALEMTLAFLAARATDAQGASADPAPPRPQPTTQPS